MRWLLLLLATACGGVSMPDGGGDAGADAGDSRSRWACNGYTYCKTADGGTDPQPFSRTFCAGSKAEADSLFSDAGPPSTCVFSHRCGTDGGSC